MVQAKYTFVAVVFVVLAAIMVVALMSGNDYQSLGNTTTGLRTLPGYPISPEEAVELARPHLDHSYVLRRRFVLPSRRGGQRPPRDWVSFKSGAYYVCRDDYPSYSPGFYIPYSVAVDATTGRITPPGAGDAGGF